MKFLNSILNFFSSNTNKSIDKQSSEEENKKFQIRYDDLGMFVYEEDGFIFQFDSGPKKIKWESIEKIVAYKIDLMTTDEVRMDIVYGDYQFTITEETPGWFQFIIKTRSVFPTITKDWDTKILFPAFATNYTVVYER